MARLFFAIWPDAPSRAALAALAAGAATRAGGRPVPAANLHLTLVFLGEVDTPRIGDLVAAAGGLPAPAFTIVLDTIGGFRRSGVAWAGCREPAKELLGLQAGLDRRVREAGFHPDARPFAPHLTLARRVRAPVTPRPIDAIAWRVSSFALVESGRTESAYRTLAEWPLELRGA
jgi:2'-5' RNA ligase